MNGGVSRYFLASNSFSGFVSHFGENYSAQEGFNTYIIKGGPGTGKSSFMKYCAARAIKNGLNISLCYCTSDPDSLDGIIIDETKTVILDGTSPHTVEPKYPGICENIIDLGRFWDEDKLKSKRLEIINAININKAFHRSAALYLSVCGELKSDNLMLGGKCTDVSKALSFADKIAKRFIPKNANGIEGERVRFIEGITPSGIMSFPKTVTNSTENIVIIEDDIGAVSQIVCGYIRNYALKMGHKIISLKNPYLPNRIYDHIIIPELSFAIVTESKYLKFDTDIRRIHSRRFLKTEQKAVYRSRMSFNEKVQNELLYSAVETLKRAKESHDIIESYYKDAMDFDGLNEMKTEFANKIIG